MLLNNSLTAQAEAISSTTLRQVVSTAIGTLFILSLVVCFGSVIGAMYTTHMLWNVTDSYTGEYMFNLSHIFDMGIIVGILSFMLIIGCWMNLDNTN